MLGSIIGELCLLAKTLDHANSFNTACSKTIECDMTPDAIGRHETRQPRSQTASTKGAGKRLSKSGAVHLFQPTHEMQTCKRSWTSLTRISTGANARRGSIAVIYYHGATRSEAERVHAELLSALLLKVLVPLDKARRLGRRRSRIILLLLLLLLLWLDLVGKLGGSSGSNGSGL